MKSHTVFVVVGVALALGGCQTYSRPPEEMRSDNAETVYSLFDAQDEQGIIAQRTVYPYHFASGTASLNTRGLQVLDVLSGYYKDHPGMLSVPRREEDEVLHMARVDAVKAHLTACGVNMDTVYITVEPIPAGGISSSEMLRILEADRKRSEQKDAEGGMAGAIMDAVGGSE